METILICGVDTDAGMHLARKLAENHRILALTDDGSQGRINCDRRRLSRQTAEAARLLLQNDHVNQVVFCGDASRSAWSCEDVACSDTSQVRIWSAACGELGIPLAFVSSDAVFTGPWMFHAEDDTCFCSSSRACSIREQEQIVTELCPGALVIRTHVIGWNDSHLMQRFVAEHPAQDNLLDRTAHATPMYAELFAELACRLLATDARGIMHLGGAERVSPRQWVSQVAEQLGFPLPISTSAVALEEPLTGFGRSECCLQSNAVRRILQTGMPTMMDSIDRIREDWTSGRVEHFLSAPIPRLSDVA
ncbi:MAG TPA: sugar nucleotide-binding protein [Planctomycetaceae bacterium]|nr:sugar nucleotide-binding protein [Planctomycetaceae bacterium]